jgi:DNA-binding NarL/FixJ family response regulator
MIDDLSPREKEILEAIAEGVTTAKGLGAYLFLSEKTIKVYLSEMYRKLGATNMTQALVVGLRKGLVQVTPR